MKTINFDYISFSFVMENTVVPKSLWRSMYGFVLYAYLHFKLWFFWVFFGDITRLMLNVVGQ